MIKMVQGKIYKTEQIIKEAIEQYNPIKIALMFSGGHDSLVSSYISASILKKMNRPFVVYHGDTTIGIPETQEYVKMICKKYGWELIIRQPPRKQDYYDSLVAKFGFPGPTRLAHQIVYRCLKERALRHWITHEVKSKPKTRENVLLLTGIRQTESIIRMGHSQVTQKDASKVWCSPIFYWNVKDCNNLIDNHNIPRNPVKEKICISGECLCGAFTSKEEWTEIKYAYPDVAKRIMDLHKVAIKNGHPWFWTQGKNQWYEMHPKNQLDMFMCVGCEAKREE